MRTYFECLFPFLQQTTSMMMKIMRRRRRRATPTPTPTPIPMFLLVLLDASPPVLPTMAVVGVVGGVVVGGVVGTAQEK